MKLFENGTVKIEKDSKYIGGRNVFRVWKLLDNKIWMFDGNVVARGYDAAYEEWTCIPKKNENDEYFY